MILHPAKGNELRLDQGRVLDALAASRCSELSRDITKLTETDRSTSNVTKLSQYVATAAAWTRHVSTQIQRHYKDDESEILTKLYFERAGHRQLPSLLLRRDPQSLLSRYVRRLRPGEHLLTWDIVYWSTFIGKLCL